MNLISVLLAVVMSMNPTAMKQQEAQEIYNNILKEDGTALYVPLVFDDTDVINAWTDGTQVVITNRLLEMSNKDEIAMVLAHEVSHILLLHTDPNSELIDSQRNKEALADKLGAFIMMRAGYDICKGKEVFRLFYNEFGDCADCDHPDNSYRLNALNLPECNDDK